MVKWSGTFQLFSLPIVILCLLQLALSLLPFWLLVPVRFLPSKARICLIDISSKLSTLDLEKFSFYFRTLVFIHFHLSHILAPCPVCLPLPSAPAIPSVFGQMAEVLHFPCSISAPFFFQCPKSMYPDHFPGPFILLWS